MATLLEPRASSPPLDAAPAPAPPKPAPERLASLDAYRGFIMIAMASSGLALPAVVKGLRAKGESSPAWEFLAFHADHVPWVGCSFWDLIQPSFMFMVGVALPYSIASRRAKGQGYGRMLSHAAWRSLLLVLLAVFLSSPLSLGEANRNYQGSTTNWIFVNVLAQIGLGYVFVFLLAGRGWKVQSGAIAAIFVAYTLFFGLWPVGDVNRKPTPGGRTDYGTLDDGTGEWGHDVADGWFAGWNKNANAAHDFDVWFLNLFPSVVPRTYEIGGHHVRGVGLAPRPEPFVFNNGGYHTLNFVPSMITMILGLMAGELLRSGRSRERTFAYLAGAACVCLAVGWLMGQTVCPLVKRIWTPSWAVFSAGWTLAMLAGFFGVIDVVGWKRWAFPLTVVGTNSIAMYLMSQQMRPWVRRALETHLGKAWFAGDFGPLWLTAAILAVFWLICWAMHRQKIFLRL